MRLLAYAPERGFRVAHWTCSNEDPVPRLSARKGVAGGSADAILAVFPDGFCVMQHGSGYILEDEPMREMVIAEFQEIRRKALAKWEDADAA